MSPSVNLQACTGIRLGDRRTELTLYPESGSALARVPPRRACSLTAPHLRESTPPVSCRSALVPSPLAPAGRRSATPSMTGRPLRAHCYKGRKVNRESGLAGQAVGGKQVEDHLWLVTFMTYDLGYFDDETCRREPIGNPFGPKVLPMSPE